MDRYNQAPISNCVHVYATVFSLMGTSPFYRALDIDMIQLVDTQTDYIKHVTELEAPSKEY